MKTLNEMRELYSNNQLQVLTAELAQNLIGKKISTLHFGYRGQDGVDTFTIGDIQSKYEIAKNQELDGYLSRAEYWESYMKPNQLDEVKSTDCIITTEGRNTNIMCIKNSGYFDEDTFTRSDADRCVYFILEDEEE